MNVRYREDQIELFSSAHSLAVDAKRPRVLAAQLVLSSENLVILTICSILVIIFAFSLGVERGKKVALNTTSVLSTAAADEREADLPVKKETPASEVTKSPVSADMAKTGMFGFLPKFAKAEDKTDVASVTKKQTAPEVVKSVKVDSKAIAKAISSDVAKVAATGFTVQVASYKSERFAQKEADALKKKGYSDVYVMNKGKFVILCVGKFTSKDGADKLTKKLRNNYQDPVVRRL
jgi:cell division septation protein DedD